MAIITPETQEIFDKEKEILLIENRFGIQVEVNRLKAENMVAYDGAKIIKAIEPKADKKRSENTL